MIATTITTKHLSINCRDMDTEIKHELTRNGACLLLLLRVQKSKKGWQVLNCSMLALVPATPLHRYRNIQMLLACLLACVDEPCVLSSAYPQPSLRLGLR